MPTVFEIIIIIPDSLGKCIQSINSLFSCVVSFHWFQKINKFVIIMSKVIESGVHSGNEFDTVSCSSRINNENNTTPRPMMFFHVASLFHPDAGEFLVSYYIA